MISSESLKQLEAFFDPQQISWKPQITKGNKALAVAYIDARDVARRLDATCAGEWSFRWELIDRANVKGSLDISGTVREDVGECGDGPAGETLKAAVSDALKRCAVQFGVGRYLYYLPAIWVGYDETRKCLTETPTLPDWARPAGPPSQGGEPNPQPAPPQDPPPTTAPIETHWIQNEVARKGFWAWCTQKGLTNQQVHDALRVQHIEEYVGSKATAFTLLQQYIANNKANKVEELRVGAAA